MIIEKSDGFLDTSLKMTNREALYWLYKSDDYKSLIPKNPIIVVNKESNELAQKIRNNVRVETEFEKIITQVKTNMIPLNQLSWIKKLNIEEVIYLDKLISNLSTNRGYRSSVFSTTDDIRDNQWNDREYRSSIFSTTDDFRDSQWNDRMHRSSIFSTTDDFRDNLSLNQSLQYKPNTNSQSLPTLIQILTFNIDYAVEGDLNHKIEFLSHLKSSLEESTIRSKEFIFFINNEKNNHDKFEEWIIRHCSSDNFISRNHNMPYLCKNNIIDYLKAHIKYYYDNDSNIAHLRLILKEIKSAWSQKKHRDKNNGKRACSFQLTEESINLLNKISKQNRRKKNEMLEILIEDAWVKMTDAKKPIRC